MGSEMCIRDRMTFCLDVKLPGKLNWVTVSHQRAFADGKANSSKDMEHLDSELSTAGLVIVEAEQEPLQTLQTAPGSIATGGSVTTTSWRDPRSNRK